MKFIRKYSNSWWVKAIMGIMAASFAAWGLGSEMFSTTPTNNTWLIKIQDKEYTINDFQTALRSLKSVQNPLNTQISEEELKQKAIDELIDNGLLEQEAKRLGIAISDDMVRHEIVGMAAFKDETGNFSREKFDMILRENNLTEMVLIDKIKQHMSQDQLLRIFQTNQGTIAPQQKDILIQAVYAPREVKIVELNAKDLPANTIPDSKTLEAFLKSNQEDFMQPESRVVSYIEITRDILKTTNPNITVSDPEIAAEYEKRAAIWNEQEKRDVRQIIIQNQQTAIATYQQLVAGSDFATVAKQNKPKTQYSQFLQNVTINSLGQEIGAVLFALPEGKFSAPIKTPLGWHIFRIEKIYPAHTKTLDSVKNQLVADIKLNKEYSLLNDLVNKIDAELKASNLETIAKTYKLEIKNAVVFADETLEENQDGPNQQSSQNKSKISLNTIKSNNQIENNSSFITAAFSTEAKQNSAPTPVYHSKSKNELDDSYIILRVNAINPEKLPEFSIIKQQVLEKWNKQHQKQQLANLATTVREMMKTTLDSKSKQETTNQDDTEPNQKIEQDNSLNPTITDSNAKNKQIESPALKELAVGIINKAKLTILSRTQAPTANLPLPLVEELFDLNQNQVSKIYTSKTTNNYLIGKVERINYFNQEQLAEQKVRLGSSASQIYQNMLLEEYLNYLRTYYNPKINTEILQRIN